MAPAQRAGRGREGVGRGPARAPRLHGRQRLLVVRDGRRRPTSPSRRARSTTPTAASRPTATPARRPARRADRRARRLPALPRSGARRRRSPSSRWIVDAPAASCAAQRPDLTLVYLPHLDYDLQRFGPDVPQADARRPTLDAALAPLLDDARGRGRAPWSCCREYGITAVAARSTSTGRCAEPGCSRCTPRRAWSTSTRGPRGRSRSPTTRSRTSTSRPGRPGRPCASCCRACPASTRCSTRAGKAAAGLDHPRAGELVLVAEPDAWFTYYYWLDDARAPDFARCVEIHRKPGYDPAELFFDPDDRLVKARRRSRSPARSSGCATR